MCPENKSKKLLRPEREDGRNERRIRKGPAHDCKGADEATQSLAGPGCER